MPGCKIVTAGDTDPATVANHGVPPRVPPAPATIKTGVAPARVDLTHRTVFSRPKMCKVLGKDELPPSALGVSGLPPLVSRVVEAKAEQDTKEFLGSDDESVISDEDALQDQELGDAPRHARETRAADHSEEHRDTKFIRETEILHDSSVAATPTGEPVSIITKDQAAIDAIAVAFGVRRRLSPEELNHEIACIDIRDHFIGMGLNAALGAPPGRGDITVEGRGTIEVTAVANRTASDGVAVATIPPWYAPGVATSVTTTGETVTLCRLPKRDSAMLALSTSADIRLETCKTAEPVTEGDTIRECWEEARDYIRHATQSGVQAARLVSECICRWYLYNEELPRVLDAIDLATVLRDLGYSRNTAPAKILPLCSTATVSQHYAADFLARAQLTRYPTTAPPAPDPRDLKLRVPDHLLVGKHSHDDHYIAMVGARGHPFLDLIFSPFSDVTPEGCVRLDHANAIRPEDPALTSLFDSIRNARDPAKRREAIARKDAHLETAFQHDRTGPALVDGKEVQVALNPFPVLLTDSAWTLTQHIPASCGLPALSKARCEDRKSELYNLKRRVTERKAERKADLHYMSAQDGQDYINGQAKILSKWVGGGPPEWWLAKSKAAGVTATTALQARLHAETQLAEHLDEALQRGTFGTVRTGAVGGGRVYLVNVTRKDTEKMALGTFVSVTKEPAAGKGIISTAVDVHGVGVRYVNSTPVALYTAADVDRGKSWLNAYVKCHELAGPLGNLAVAEMFVCATASKVGVAGLEVVRQFEAHRTSRLRLEAILAAEKHKPCARAIDAALLAASRRWVETGETRLGHVDLGFNADDVADITTIMVERYDTSTRFKDRGALESGLDHLHVERSRIMFTKLFPEPPLPFIHKSAQPLPSVESSYSDRLNGYNALANPEAEVRLRPPEHWGPAMRYDTYLAAWPVRNGLLSFSAKVSFAFAGSVFPGHAVSPESIARSTTEGGIFGMWKNLGAGTIAGSGPDFKSVNASVALEHMRTFSSSVELNAGAWAHVKKLVPGCQRLLQRPGWSAAEFISAHVKEPCVARFASKEQLGSSGRDLSIMNNGMRAAVKLLETLNGAVEPPGSTVRGEDVGAAFASIGVAGSIVCDIDIMKQGPHSWATMANPARYMYRSELASWAAWAERQIDNKHVHYPVSAFVGLSAKRRLKKLTQPDDAAEVRSIARGSCDESMRGYCEALPLVLEGGEWYFVRGTQRSYLQGLLQIGADLGMACLINTYSLIRYGGYCACTNADDVACVWPGDFESIDALFVVVRGGQPMIQVLKTGVMMGDLTLIYLHRVVRAVAASATQMRFQMSRASLRAVGVAGTEYRGVSDQSAAANSRSISAAITECRASTRQLMYDTNCILMSGARSRGGADPRLVGTLFGPPQSVPPRVADCIATMGCERWPYLVLANAAKFDADTAKLHASLFQALGRAADLPAFGPRGHAAVKRLEKRVKDDLRDWLKTETEDPKRHTDADRIQRAISSSFNTSQTLSFVIMRASSHLFSRADGSVTDVRKVSGPAAVFPLPRVAAWLTLKPSDSQGAPQTGLTSRPFDDPKPGATELDLPTVIMLSALVERESNGWVRACRRVAGRLATLGYSVGYSPTEVVLCCPPAGEPVLLVAKVDRMPDESAPWVAGMSFLYSVVAGLEFPSAEGVLYPQRFGAKTLLLNSAGIACAIETALAVYSPHDWVRSHTDKQFVRVDVTWEAHRVSWSYSGREVYSIRYVSHSLGGYCWRTTLLDVVIPLHVRTCVCHAHVSIASRRPELAQINENLTNAAHVISPFAAYQGNIRARCYTDKASITFNAIAIASPSSSAQLNAQLVFDAGGTVCTITEIGATTERYRVASNIYVRKNPETHALFFNVKASSFFPLQTRTGPFAMTNRAGGPVRPPWVDPGATYGGTASFTRRDRLPGFSVTTSSLRTKRTSEVLSPSGFAVGGRKHRVTSAPESTFGAHRW